MQQLPSRKRVWAIAYGLTLVIAAPLLFVQQVWSNPLPPRKEGVLHLKRGVDSVDVDSLLDTNQPDFFLRIEMASPSPVPQVTAETLPPPAPSGSPVAQPSSQGAAEPSPTPSPSPMPTPSPTPYEPHLLGEDASTSAPKPTPTPKPVPTPDPIERTQVVADALYHAPRLAREGRYRQALELIDTALNLDDRLAPLHALRGSVCYKLGRMGEAEEAWARAVDLDPGMTDARKALDWIRNRNQRR